MKLIALCALPVQLAAALWPIPASVSTGETVLWMDQSVQVEYTVGKGGNATYDKNGGGSKSNQIVNHSIKRTYDTIFQGGFIPWKFNPPHSDFEPSTAEKPSIKSVKLTQTEADPENIMNALAGDIDESYSLELSESGDVTITAVTSVGIARGLTTFSQLFYKHSKGGAYTKLAPVSIKDEPKFLHRGLNMDVSRNFYEVKDIKRMIDGMAFAKMNRFHIHITDSQSWPLEVPALPELAAKGSYAPGLTYSPKDLEEIQHYGAVNGISVTIEIDMPGHFGAASFAFPDIVAAYNKQPDWDTYCAEPPCGTLKLNSPAVYDFLDKLMGDVLPRISPYTAYFYTGGDELNKNSYLLDDTVNSNDSAVLQPLLQKFVSYVHDLVRDNGLVPVVWEEMLLDWNLTLGEDTVIQTWRSDEAVAQTTGKGFKALVGNYNYWYLDCGKGQWIDFKPGASSQQFWPYLDYCNPVKNWRLIYSYDPYSGVPEGQHDLVIGGEAHLWAEQTDPVNIDKMAWPRAGAVAEVLWSGPKDADGKNRSQIEASPRLSDFRERLVARGIMAEPIQMPFCLQTGSNCAL